MIGSALSLALLASAPLAAQEVKDAAAVRPLRQKSDAPDSYLGFSVNFDSATGKYRGDGAKFGMGFGLTDILHFGGGNCVRFRLDYTEFNHTYTHNGVDLDAKDGITALGAEYYYQSTSAKGYGAHDLTHGYYLFAGTALDRVDARTGLNGGTGYASSTRFELSAGAGYQFSTHFCAEARYRHIPTSGIDIHTLQGSLVYRF
jgi:hypothetical protein